MGFRFKRRVKTHSNSSIATLIMSGSTDLADGAVTSIKIAASAVAASQLAANSVFSTKIVDGSVLPADLDVAVFGTTVSPYR